jgi:hypothetical protein
MENTNEKLINGSHNNSDSQNINHDFCEKNNCKINNNYNDTDNNNNDNVEKCTANFCISCGLNLGYNNPRQFCRKTYCPYE